MFTRRNTLSTSAWFALCAALFVSVPAQAQSTRVGLGLELGVGGAPITLKGRGSLFDGALEGTLEETDLTDVDHTPGLWLAVDVTLPALPLSVGGEIGARMWRGEGEDGDGFDDYATQLDLAARPGLVFELVPLVQLRLVATVGLSYAVPPENAGDVGGHLGLLLGGFVGVDIHAPVTLRAELGYLRTRAEWERHGRLTDLESTLSFGQVTLRAGLLF